MYRYRWPLIAALALAVAGGCEARVELRYEPRPAGAADFEAEPRGRDDDR